MPSRHRLTLAALLLLWAVHPASVSATESRMDAGVPAVDTVQNDSQADATRPAPEPLGIAAASCHVGAQLAAENPWTLGAVGFALCMMGIYMEVDEFFNAPTR